MTKKKITEEPYYLKNKKRVLKKKIPSLHGEGTEEKPFEIYNELDFKKITEVLYHTSYLELLHFKLMNDINFGYQIIFPIGTHYNIPFRGFFDGNHHTIQNCTIVNPFLNNDNKRHMTGLFGRIQDAVIKDLNLKNIEIFGIQDVGILTGEAKYSKISNCDIQNSAIYISSSFLQRKSPIIEEPKNIGAVIGDSFLNNKITKVNYEVMIYKNNDSYLGELLGNKGSYTKIIDCCKLTPKKPFILKRKRAI